MQTLIRILCGCSFHKDENATIYYTVLNFFLTVKAVPHDCVIRTGLPWIKVESEKKSMILFECNPHPITPQYRHKTYASKKICIYIHIYLLIGLRTYRTSVGPRSECSQEQSDPDPHCFSFKLQKHFCIRRMKTTYCDWRS